VQNFFYKKCTESYQSGSCKKAFWNGVQKVVGLNRTGYFPIKDSERPDSHPTLWGFRVDRIRDGIKDDSIRKNENPDEGTGKMSDAFFVWDVYRTWYGGTDLKPACHELAELREKYLTDFLMWNPYLTWRYRGDQEVQEKAKEAIQKHIVGDGLPTLHVDEDNGDLLQLKPENLSDPIMNGNFRHHPFIAMKIIHPKTKEEVVTTLFQTCPSWCQVHLAGRWTRFTPPHQFKHNFDPTPSCSEAQTLKELIGRS
jgi:hypothetical protein